jgi:hypothetical protein
MLRNQPCSCRLMADMIGDMRFPIGYDSRFREYTISGDEHG